jgi:hypothetical protein
MKAKQSHAKYLHFLNEKVEIAKLPAHEQESKLTDLGQRPDNLPVLLEGLTRGDDLESVRKFYHIGLTRLRCGIVAVAVARYRQAEGRWPNDLNALVPKYLSSVPCDPFEGKPLRWVGSQEEAGACWTIRAIKVLPEYPKMQPAYFRLWEPKERQK